MFVVPAGDAPAPQDASKCDEKAVKSKEQSLYLAIGSGTSHHRDVDVSCVSSTFSSTTTTIPMNSDQLNQLNFALSSFT